MLELRNVCKRFGDVVALDGLSLHVERGGLVGFLGPNGAGKTTTMRAIMQLLTIDEGTITWDGLPITFDQRRRIGYMPAERGMYPKMRVREHVVYYARLGGLDRPSAERSANRWLERVGLAERASSDVQDLSSGNQQRVQLALALVNDPELLVLDEPFSGLDPLAAETLKEIVLERVEGGTALLFSSHQLDLVADVSRKVVIIDGGRVVLEGDVQDIRANAPYRYIDVVFDSDVLWRPDLAGVDVIATEPRRARLRVAPDADASSLLQHASAAGTVTEFTFAPPDLSEVFLGAVRGPQPGAGVR